MTSGFGGKLLYSPEREVYNRRYGYTEHFEQEFTVPNSSDEYGTNLTYVIDEAGYRQTEYENG